MAAALTTCVHTTMVFLRCRHKQGSGLEQCNEHINSDFRCHKVDKRTQKINRLCDKCLGPDLPWSAARPSSGANVSSSVQVSQAQQNGTAWQCEPAQGGGVYFSLSSVSSPPNAGHTFFETAQPALQTPYNAYYGYHGYNGSPSPAFPGSQGYSQSHWGMLDSTLPQRDAFLGGFAGPDMRGVYNAAGGTALVTTDTGDMQIQSVPAVLDDTGFAYYTQPTPASNTMSWNVVMPNAPGSTYGNIPSSSTEPAT